MEQPKLDRNQRNTINAHQSDRLYLWDSPVHTAERQNLTLQDCNGNDVLTVYALTYDQLAGLYLDIALTLGKSPDPTVHHLRQIYEAIGKLIDTVNPAEQNWRDP